MSIRALAQIKFRYTVAFSIACGMLCGLVSYHILMTTQVESFEGDSDVLLALTSSYVATYAELRGSLNDSLPVPATFRARTSSHFNEHYNGDSHFSVNMVGPPGRYIASSPTDAGMTSVFESMRDAGVESIYTTVLRQQDDYIVRTMYPSIASQRSCVDCHNEIQDLETPWAIGDVMGAYVVERSILSTTIRCLALATLLGTLVSVSLILALKALVLHGDLLRRAAQLRELAETDSLTGCRNRRALDKVVTGTSRASQENAAVLFLDLDHFKRINDQYGHDVGDQVLVWFTSTVRALLRSSDVLVRAGGEEFTLYMPDVSESAAQRIAQRICQHVAAEKQQFGNHSVRVTVSIGGVHTARSPGRAFKVYEKMADTLLYSAKANGRNQVVWSNSS